MTFNPEEIRSNLIAQASEEDKQLFRDAAKVNRYFVDAIPLFGGGYAIGTMDETLPWVSADRREIEREIEEMQQSYLDEIKAGERDGDDEYEGELMQIAFTGVNEFALYPADAKVYDIPLYVGELKDAMGL